MNKLTHIIFLIFVFLLSCNTKQENKASENIITDNNNLSLLFTKSELNSKTLDELKLIRNEIYARKGYVFKSKELEKYFSKQEWYTPKENEEITLTEKEKQYVDLIKQVEDNKKKDLTPSIKPTNSETTRVQRYNSNKL